MVSSQQVSSSRIDTQWLHSDRKGEVWDRDAKIWSFSGSTWQNQNRKQNPESCEGSELQEKDCWIHCLEDLKTFSRNPWRLCNESLRTSSPCASSQWHPTCSWVPRPKGQGLQGGAKSILGISKDKKTWRTTFSSFLICLCLLTFCPCRFQRGPLWCLSVISCQSVQHFLVCCRQAWACSWATKLTLR